MLCPACRLARHQLAGGGGGRRFAAAMAASAATTATVPAAHAACRTARTALPLRRRGPCHALRAAAARPYSAAAANPPPSSSSSSSSSSTSSPTTPPKPDFLDAAESHIWDLLVAAFAPQELSVRDISGGCGSMYGIEISSARFRGASTLQQQRMVNGALGALIKGWHGVQLKTRVPE